VTRRLRVERSAPLVLRTGARGSRLSEGGLIQGSVRARLLGIPLLRLDATIAVIPGISLLPHAVEPGRSLSEAVRRINEGAEVLEHVRRESRALSVRES
jgi:hypothetical protein